MKTAYTLPTFETIERYFTNYNEGLNCKMFFDEEAQCDPMMKEVSLFTEYIQEEDSCQVVGIDESSLNTEKPYMTIRDRESTDTEKQSFSDLSHPSTPISLISSDSDDVSSGMLNDKVEDLLNHATVSHFDDVNDRNIRETLGLAPLDHQIEKQPKNGEITSFSQMENESSSSKKHRRFTKEDDYGKHSLTYPINPIYP